MKILEPITVGGVVFKNRIMFPPLTTGYEDKDGNITPQSRAFYTRLAKGGTGYIVLGDVAPIRSFAPTPKLFEDSQIESFRLLAESVHQYGAKLGVQIFHPEYDCDAINILFDNGQFEEVRARVHHDMEFFGNEVTEKTLLKIIKKMCDCAIRAEKAGVDVIQIHGDRLVGALCSTKMNTRTDKFGGSLENRARFALMLVHALKEAVPNMILEYKFPVVTPERGRGGIDEVDAPQFAKWLEEAGIDMLHVAQANHTGNLADTIPPMGVQPYMFFVDIAAAVKNAVTIPVSAVGRIIDPEMAEAVLESGKADMIGLGRALLADPDWITKAEAGKSCDIRRCISCNRGCTDNIQNRAFVACVLNAENGFEETRSITPAEIKKNIVVVGGGPNVCDAWKVLSGKEKVHGRVAVIGGGLVGCETAEFLAEQGCKVSLIEKKDTIADGISNTVLPTLLENYRTFGVEQFTGNIVKSISEKQIVCENKNGKETIIPCDFVVMAIGSKSVVFDTSELIECGIKVVKIGDCKEVADISHAIKTGYDAANTI